MEFDFKGKTALVTGASNGIGRDIAIKLSQCGVNVIAIGRSLNDLDSLKEKTNCKIIQLDLSDWKKTREAVKDIDNVDFLINNAGQTLRKSLLNTSYEDLNRILDINFKACMNLTQIFVRKMVESGKPGSIVNVSSLCGLVGQMDHSVYCASKGAMDAFTRAVAMEYGKYNIRINSVNPTVILSSMGQDFCKDNEKFKAMIEKTPIKRLGKPEEVTYPVLFLLSDMASLITGTCLTIDGGYSIN